MKAILVGIGSFGYSWYKNIKEQYPTLDLVIVERNEALAERLIAPRDPFYTDLKLAISREKPDFLINLTPPAVHTEVNHLAFDHRLPVLCEKPIAEDYFEAVEIVNRAQREQIPFMIAENYRRAPAFRLARQMIDQGEAGELAAVTVQFSKEAYFEKEYLVRMPDPLLQDVAVHHLDLIRYLTNSEGRKIQAFSYNPKGSRYPGNAAINFTLVMDQGIVVNYTGSLAAKDCETGWPGNWRLEGMNGVMTIRESEISLVSHGKEKVLTDFNQVDTSSCLDEFLQALSEDREPESSGADYLKTQKLVYYAQISSRLGCMVDVEDSKALNGV